MILVPAPDPAPHTGHKPVTYGAYDYFTPGVLNGRLVPGLWFKCHVPVKGRRVCVVFWGHGR